MLNSFAFLARKQIAHLDCDMAIGARHKGALVSIVVIPNKGAM